MQPDLFPVHPLIGRPATIGTTFARCITTGKQGYCMGMWVYIHAIDGDNAVCETSQSWQAACQQAGTGGDWHNRAGNLWRVPVNYLRFEYQRWSKT